MKYKKPSQMELNKLVNTFTVYKFINDITSDFDELKSFEKGFIDKDGEYKKDPKGISAYDRLIINLKKLLAMIPNPSIKSKLKNITTAISLFCEETESIGGDSELLFNDILDILKEEGLNLDEVIDEEMSVGGGFISNVSPENSEGQPDKTGIPFTALSRKAQIEHIKNKKIGRRKKTDENEKFEVSTEKTEPNTKLLRIGTTNDPY